MKLVSSSIDSSKYQLNIIFEIMKPQIDTSDTELYPDIHGAEIVINFNKCIHVNNAVIVFDPILGIDKKAKFFWVF